MVVRRGALLLPSGQGGQFAIDGCLWVCPVSLSHLAGPLGRQLDRQDQADHGSQDVPPGSKLEHGAVRSRARTGFIFVQHLHGF